MLRPHLKDPQSLIAASTSKWANECIPEFNRLPFSDEGVRSNWALIDQESGLCTGDLFSVFTSADPNPNKEKDKTPHHALSLPLLSFLNINTN